MNKPPVSVHDKPVLDLKLHWFRKAADITFRIDDDSNLLLKLEGVRLLEVPREDAWGPSDQVNRLTATEIGTDHLINIEVQSCDTIVIRCSSYCWELIPKKATPVLSAVASVAVAVITLAHC